MVRFGGQEQTLFLSLLGLHDSKEEEKFACKHSALTSGAGAYSRKAGVVKAQGRCKAAAAKPYKQHGAAAVASTPEKIHSQAFFFFFLFSSRFFSRHLQAQSTL